MGTQRTGFLSSDRCKRTYFILHGGKDEQTQRKESLLLILFFIENTVAVGHLSGVVFFLWCSAN